MPANGRFGGHMVLGHVDGTGTIESIRPEADFWWVTVSYPAGLAPYLIHRGSIAIDGISLTIARLEKTTLRCADRPVHVGAHEPAQQPRRRSREPRMRHGRQVRAPRRGIDGDKRYERTTQDREGSKEGRSVRARRGRHRGVPRRRDHHRLRRRGSRERRGPDAGGREGDAEGDQLHGEVRPRAHLHADDRRAARRARDSA